MPLYKCTNHSYLRVRTRQVHVDTTQTLQAAFEITLELDSNLTSSQKEKFSVTFDCDIQLSNSFSN